VSIRARITLATAGIMALVVAILSLGIHWTLSRGLHAEMDQRLHSVYDTYVSNPTYYVDSATGEYRAVLPQPDPFASPGLYIQVMDTELEVRGQSSTLDRQRIEFPAEALQTNQQREDAYYDAQISGTGIRVYSAPIVDNAGRIFAYIQIAESVEPLNATLKRQQTILIVGSLAATLTVALAAWLVADAALRPLARMTSTARAIGGAGDLSQRIDPPRTHDEVQQLADTFNAMLDRLEVSFEAQRRFVADASHELRTPLTALRGNADILLRMTETDRLNRADLVEGLTDIGGEADRLSRLVQNLLTLARADGGWTPEMEPVDLATVTRDAARVLAPLFHDRTLTIQVPTPEKQSLILVDGNTDQLKQLILILLDNARTHTPAGSEVTLSLDTTESQAVLTVQDSGRGIEPEHLDRIFDRFYRADSSRDRVSGGTGLGLAIAKWIVSIHGGEISATSEPGRGARFTVEIPLLPEEAVALLESYGSPLARDIDRAGAVPQSARALR
jgi:heavy metal sensor kinase